MTQVNLENRTWARSAMRLSVELPIGALKAYRVLGIRSLLNCGVRSLVH